jgi:hypothetical protein
MYSTIAMLNKQEQSPLTTLNNTELSNMHVNVLLE